MVNKMSEQVKTTKKEAPVLKWYVVRAISGQEKKVKQYIEVEINRLGLNDYVSQVLIPTEKIIQVRNGKKIAKERSFYPGYVLIEAILVGEIPHTIKNITGVIGFLGETKGGEPVPMRLAEVNRILGKVDELTESEGTVSNTYVVGESIKVINGPFNGFNGVIEEINEEKKKIKVTVKKNIRTQNSCRAWLWRSRARINKTNGQLAKIINGALSLLPTLVIRNQSRLKNK